jgi:LmbE family N-acetylglucosaminyl deacetylase
MKPPQRGFSRVAGLLTLGWSDSPTGRLFLRRTIARFARIALRLRSNSLPVGLPNPVLVIAPHPDDETFGCGGTLALISRERAPLHIAFVTDGGASHPNHPILTAPEVAARRQQEAHLATERLGISWDKVTFLGARDGTLAQLDGGSYGALADRISGLLQSVKPQTILLPCRSDGSSEHEAAFRLVSTALERAGLKPRLLEFPVWSWWNPFILLGAMSGYRKVWRVDLGEARVAKAQAVASYVSQTHPIPPDTEPALPPGFAAMFLGREEFLLER